MPHFILFRTISGPFFKQNNNAEYQNEQEIIHYLYDGGIDKSVPWDHNFSSLRKSHNAKWQTSGQIFLSHPDVYDIFLLSSTCYLSQAVTYGLCICCIRSQNHIRCSYFTTCSCLVLNYDLSAATW